MDLFQNETPPETSAKALLLGLATGALRVM